eukprot:7600665-Pyramimonas_sp.AAC.1
MLTSFEALEHREAPCRLAHRSTGQPQATAERSRMHRRHRHPQVRARSREGQPRGVRARLEILIVGLGPSRAGLLLY